MQDTTLSYVWNSLAAELQCGDVTLLTFGAHLKAAPQDLLSFCTVHLGCGKSALYNNNNSKKSPGECATVMHA